MVKNYLFILFLGALSLLARDVFAVTAVPWPVEKTQPDGTVISVYLRGDEQVHWMESMDGYTLMYDDQKYVVYAKQDARGNMVPSNIRYGGVGVQSTSPKGLRYSEDQVKALKQIWEITSDSGGLRSSGQQKVGATTGPRQALCVLVGFSDRPFGKTVGDFNILFNQVNLYPADGSVKGSVRDFFRENSYEQLDFTVTVVGPYLAPNTTEYYASHEREFATFAADAADVDVEYKDFADEGILETFHILFAGYGDEAIGNGKQIWSHKWQLASPIYRDEVRISVYSCSPELRGTSGNNITHIGVVCHELSHVFGAPDYYDTGSGAFSGTGSWDLMANGSWNDNGRQPAHINMFQKMLYGWVTPEELTTQTTITDMPPSALDSVAYKIQANDNGELYVLENKQPVGFDASLPGHGLLIWHVHPAALGGAGSNAAHPQQLYPVVASSTTQIPNVNPASYGSINSTGTPFPGSSGNTSFTGKSTPAMFTWAGLQTVAKPVTEIAEAADKTISFKFLDGPTDPITSINATVTGNDVRLDWTPPANSDIRGYKIFRNEALQFSTNNKDMITYTQVGVPKGDYEYCVSAVYEVTESAKTCIPVSVTTGSDEFYLPVSNLQATAGINDVNLSWTAPGGWTGIAGNYDGYYGLGNAKFDFFTGTLWNPSDLKGLNGFQISKVRFVPLESISSGATYAVAIYEVPASGEPQLIYTQNVTGSLSYSAYNEITLSNPVSIDATKGVIVGIQAHASVVPVSVGDAYPGRNLLHDEDGWYTLEDIGFNLGHNYCLQVHLDGTTGSSALPEPNIPANTSFLKKNSGKKLPIGGMIANDGFSQAPPAITTYHIYRDGVEVGTSTTPSYTDSGLTQVTAYAYCVTVEYADGNSSEGVCIEVKTDTPYKPVSNLKAKVEVAEVTLTWEPQISYTTLFEEDFENGIPATWGNVDKDGDNYKWEILSSPNTTPQSGNNVATSASYINDGYLELTPDNWLVTPAITLTDNNVLRYYVNAQDADYPAEHYGVYISTSNTVPGTFDLLTEETMTASPGKPVDNPAPGAFRSSGPQYIPGAWYERTIDLSAYNGQTVYIAFRHFATTNEFQLNLDNVKILVPVVNPATITYNVYEEGTPIITGLTSPKYILNGAAVGTHNYCVTAVYGGVNESETTCVGAIVESPYQPVGNLKAQVVAGDINLTWKPQFLYSTLFEEDFENGIPADWGNVDDDNDTYKWEIRTGSTAQSGSKSVTSASFVFVPPYVLEPDNWLITPAITLTDNNLLRYYVSAQEALFPEEKYGVFISTSNTVPGTFEPLFEEIMTPSPGKPVDNPAPGAFRSTGPQYVPGAWYERTIDLSAYNGQTVYIAFRHFDCTDQWSLNLDNVKILEPFNAGAITYNVSENGTQIETGLTSPQYALNDKAVGTYEYCVTAVYDGITESVTTCIGVTVVPLGNPHPPVSGLKATVTDLQAELTWNAPAFAQKLRYHTFDEGEFAVLGLTGAGSFDAATRWTPDDLKSADGLMLTKVRFIPLAPKTDISYAVRVWIGGGNPSEGAYVPGQLVIDQPISDFTVEAWNEVVLNTAVPIDLTQEIWIGLHCTLTTACNAVPRQAESTLDGKGNLVYLNGEWSTLMDLAGIPGNWIFDGIASFYQGMDPSIALPELKDEYNPISSATLTALEGGTSANFIEQAPPPLPIVGEYIVTRDGEEIGTTTETHFSDEVPEEAVYAYSVTAVYTDGIESEATPMVLSYITYDITIAGSENGSIVSDSEVARETDLVTLTASPAEGYEVDEVTVTKTDDADTSVEVSGSGITYTFTMPGYAVTVQATFKKTDVQILEEVQGLLEERTYTVYQGTANTDAQVTDWLVQTINAEILSSGVTITADDVTIDDFAAAIAGSEFTPNGINGSFAFTVSLALNAASVTTTGLLGTITPIIYTPPAPTEEFYTLSIPEAEGLIINWGAGSHAVSEFTFVTITFQAAEGYSIAGLHVYANGAEKALTANGEGVYELALGYLSANVAITVDGIERSGSVGIMASPENGALRVVKADGGLQVYGLKPGIEFRIYSVSGLLVYQGKAIETEQFIPLRDRGFYIIVSDGSSVKAAL